MGRLLEDTGTWNMPIEERERIRKENEEKNRQGLQNALNESNRIAQESRDNGGSSGGSGIYSPGYTGTQQKQPSQPKKQQPKQPQEDPWDNIIDTTPDVPVVPQNNTQNEPETTAPKTGNQYEPTGGMVLPPSYPQPTPAETPAPAVPEPVVPAEPETTETGAKYYQPRNMPYDPRSRNDNNAGVPRATEDEDTTGLYQNGIDNLIDNNDVPDNEWTPTADTNGSALGGTNYVGNGYVPTNLLRSEDFNRVTPYDPTNTVYSSTGQLREVGLGPNGIYDRPVGISPDDFYYQGGLEAGLSPEEAIQYSLEEHEKEGTTPVFNTVGEMMDYYANDARNDYREASEDIPENPNRYDPYSAIDRYREGGGPQRDAEFKAAYRNVVNRFDHRCSPLCNWMDLCFKNTRIFAYCKEKIKIFRCFFTFCRSSWAI